jgi:hypothetical protein
MKRKSNLIITYNNIYNDFHEESESIRMLQEEFINRILKAQDEFIEHVLRNHVTPPIKGEITRGKIKWRGLEILNDIQSSKLWIRQRGVDIHICFDYSIKPLDFSL